MAGLLCRSGRFCGSLLWALLFWGGCLSSTSSLAQQPGSPATPSAELAQSQPASDKAKQKQEKEKLKKQISIVAGTTFMDPGFALAGIKVRLERLDGKKPKPQEVLSDSRGEFAFYLPAAEMKFKVTATGKGLEPEVKEVSTSPGVRTDVYFTLKRAAP